MLLTVLISTILLFHYYVFYNVQIVYELSISHFIYKNKFLIFQNKKALKLSAKGLGMVRLPRQNDYRTFCMNEEAEKVYHKLEELTYI